MQKYQVISRKYRPQTFKDVVGQQTIVTTLKNALKFQKIAHAYLFCGGRGSGKTTLARLFAKSLNCQNIKEDFEPCNKCSSCLEIIQGQSLDVIEIDGASNRGIDDIRQINETVEYASSTGRYKIYIIDEVHMLTKEAFNALLKTLEEPPEQAKFFFATTEPHKILPTIISRCQRFDLQRIDTLQIVSKLKQIAFDLSKEVSEEALYKIAELSDGSLRDAESLFDQILCFVEGPIESNTVRQVFGLVPEEIFFSLDLAFSEGNLGFAFTLIDSLYRSGKDLGHFMTQLIEHFRQIAMLKMLGSEGAKGPLAAKYLEQAKLYTKSQSLYLLEYVILAESQMQKSVAPRVFVENALLHILRSKNKIPVEVLVKRLLELEKSLGKPQETQSSPYSALAIKNEEEIPTKTKLSSQEMQALLQGSTPELKVPELKAPIKPILEISKDPIPAAPLNIAIDEKLVESLKVDAFEPVKNLSQQEPTRNAQPVKIEQKTPINDTFSSQLFPKESSSLESLKVPSLPPMTQSDFFMPSNPLPTAENENSLKENIDLTLAQTKTIQTSETQKIKHASSQKHPSHYDTIMRFAAVELEGSLKI